MKVVTETISYTYDSIFHIFVFMWCSGLQLMCYLSYLHFSVSVFVRVTTAETLSAKFLQLGLAALD